MKVNNLKTLILFFILIFSFFYGQQKTTAEEKVEIEEEKIGLFPFRDSITGEWGYINKEGTIVIKPQFGMADNFSEGLARVRIGEKRFYINKEGKIVKE